MYPPPPSIEFLLSLNCIKIEYFFHSLKPLATSLNRRRVTKLIKSAVPFIGETKPLPYNLRCQLNVTKIILKIRCFAPFLYSTTVPNSLFPKINNHPITRKNPVTTLSGCWAYKCRQCKFQMPRMPD